MDMEIPCSVQYMYVYVTHLVYEWEGWVAGNSAAEFVALICAL